MLFRNLEVITTSTMANNINLFIPLSFFNSWHIYFMKYIYIYKYSLWYVYANETTYGTDTVHYHVACPIIDGTFNLWNVYANVTTGEGGGFLVESEIWFQISVLSIW